MRYFATGTTFRLIYQMQVANFCALAVFLANWLALHFPTAGMSSQLLSIVDVTQSFWSFCDVIRRQRCHYLHAEGQLPPSKLLYSTRDLKFFHPTTT